MGGFISFQRLMFSCCSPDEDIEQKTKLLSPTKAQDLPPTIYYPPVQQFPTAIKNEWVAPEESKLITPSPKLEVEVGNRAISVEDLSVYLKLHFPFQDSHYEYHFAHEKSHLNYGGETEIGTVLLSFNSADSGSNLLIRNGYSNEYYSSSEPKTLEEFLKSIDSPITMSQLRQLNVKPEELVKLDEKLVGLSWFFSSRHNY